jgi:hypothetical protein
MQVVWVAYIIAFTLIYQDLKSILYLSCAAQLTIRIKKNHFFNAKQFKKINEIQS